MGMGLASGGWGGGDVHDRHAAGDGAVAGLELGREGQRQLEPQQLG